MIDWKQKLKNQWVQIEISRVQPGKPGNFLPLGPFPFQYSSDLTGDEGVEGVRRGTLHPEEECCAEEEEHR